MKKKRASKQARNSGHTTRAQYTSHFNHNQSVISIILIWRCIGCCCFASMFFALVCWTQLSRCLSISIEQNKTRKKTTSSNIVLCFARSCHCIASAFRFSSSSFIAGRQLCRDHHYYFYLPKGRKKNWLHLRRYSRWMPLNGTYVCTSHRRHYILVTVRISAAAHRKASIISHAVKMLGYSCADGC